MSTSISPKKTLGKRRKRLIPASVVQAAIAAETGIAPAKNGSNKGEVRSLLDALVRMNPASAERLWRNVKKKQHGNISVKYIKAVFFPEFFKARIPYNLSNRQSAIVTQVDTMLLSTGPLG